ncbi:MAG: lysylphosphatidylglycerol synthase domain-containing protein [Cytophagales bacterium]
MVKLAVFIGCVGYVSLKLSKVINLYQEIDQQIEHLKTLHKQVYFYLAIFLVLFNWSLEAWKWKILSSFEKRTSFFDALKGVLAGLGLGAVAPLGIGDYLGRLSVNQYKNRKQLILNLWFGHQCQLFATAFFASLSFLIFFKLNNRPFETFDILLFFISSCLTLSLSLIIMFFNRIFQKAIILFNFDDWTVSKLKPSKVSQVLLLSILRYFVFASQFYLISLCFLSKTDTVDFLTSIGLMFFLKSILPAFNFVSDLGIREFSAMYFFGKLNVDETGIIAISLTVWCINLFLPSLIGMMIVFLKRIK